MPTHVALWEWCARRLPPDDFGAFESWACSRRFDVVWVLDQMLDIMTRGTQLSCYRLMDYLEEIFDEEPLRVTRVLVALVECQAEIHEVHAARQAILRIVKRAHDAGELVAREGRRLANLMTARGFYDEFKALT